MADSDIRRIGFTDLTRGRTSPLNVVFVHGLMGHPQKTWQIEKEAVSASGLRSIFKSTPKRDLNSAQLFFWPRDLLAEDLPNAKVWTYGYDADALQGIFAAKNKNSISQHANDLKVKLERTIQGKIIFIAHSLGGVLVKDVIWQSALCQENTKGVIFLGTPHRGSSLGDYAGIAANLAGMALQDINHKLVRSLEVDSQVLNIINREFVKTITKLRIPIHSFQEGKPISGVKGLHDKVVSDYSSALDIDPSLETKETINHDHKRMAKCENRSDEQYIAILGVATQLSLDTAMTVINGPSATRETYAAESGTTSDREVRSYYTIPYANREFTGRHEQIQELQDKLLTQDDFQEFAICGLGGIGKTQLAIAFCHSIKAHYPKYSIFWVSALSRASFEKDYIEIARKCAIPIIDKKRTLQTVQQYLESSAVSPWIMIVDNADMKELLLDSEQGIKQYLPEHRNGIRIYTSRDIGLIHDINLAIDIMVMEEMEYHDAKGLLLRYLGDSDVLHSEDITTELLEELEFIPLAIVQAASFIKNAYITVPQYLNLMRKTYKNKAKLSIEEHRQAARYDKSDKVTITWLISFDRIRTEEGSALRLLYFLAVIQNKDIPYSILPQEESEMDLLQAVGVLRNYSFLVKQDKADIYDMHRLVHQAIRKWMQNSAVIDRLGEWQVAHLVKIWPSAEIKNESLWQKYLPHAIAAVLGSAEAPTEERSELSLLVGRCLRIDGRVREAIDLLADCCSWRSEQLDRNDKTSLAAHRELAIAYRWSGHEVEAIQILSRVVQEEQDLPELGDAHRLQTLYELGMAQLWVGDSIAAVAALERVVDGLDQTGGSADLLEAIHGLVLAYRANSQPEKASELLIQNPGVERKLQFEAAGEIRGHSSSHSTKTLGEDLIKALDLIGKLDLIRLHVFEVDAKLELLDTIAMSIPYARISDILCGFSTTESTDPTLEGSVGNSQEREPLIDIVLRSRDLVRLLGAALKYPEKHGNTGAYDLSVRANRTIWYLTKLASLYLFEQYSIRERANHLHHLQHLSVGPVEWAIERRSEGLILFSERIAPCVLMMKLCWTSIAETHGILKGRASLSPLSMIHNQSITIRNGLDGMFGLIHGRQLDVPNIRWKMCLAIEYWQQGYPEPAIMYMEAARRNAKENVALHTGCLKWLQQFESAKTDVGVVPRTRRASFI